jgi:hypothetical protein
MNFSEMPSLTAPDAGTAHPRTHWRPRFRLWVRRHEFGQDRPQGLDARRERVTIVSGNVGKLFV